jgi:hypothetical protein
MVYTCRVPHRRKAPALPLQKLISNKTGDDLRAGRYY